MHELILKAQDELIEQLENNIEILEQIEKTADVLGKTREHSDKKLQIIYALLQQKAFGATDSMRLGFLSEFIGLVTQQTGKYVSGLEQQGVVVKTRGRDPIMFALANGVLEEFGIEN